MSSRALVRRSALSCLFALVCACRGDEKEASANDDEGSSTRGDESGNADGSSDSSGLASDSTEGSDSTTGSDTGTEDTEDSDTGAIPSCSEAQAAIAEQLSTPEDACNLVVRFRRGSLEPLGWASECGPPLTPNLALDAEAALALADIPQATVVTPQNEHDYFLIYKSPSDFGAFALVSNHLGSVSLAGSIIWAGAGELKIPARWQAPAILGQGCVGELFAGIGYRTNGAILDELELEAALGALADTAVQAAIADAGGTASQVLVIEYIPARGGDRVLELEEYIVVVEIDG